MKKIIPFKKEMFFKTNISEITSISLEHQLSIDGLNIKGEFIVNGDYKVTDNSNTVEAFDFKIPFEIVLDEIYDTSKAICDIDDFYYEIVNDKILVIYIDVCIDKLSEILVRNELFVSEEKHDIIEELMDDQNNDSNILLDNLEENKVIEKNDDKIIEDKNLEKRCIEEDDIIPGEEKIIMNELSKEELVEKNNIDTTEKIDKKNENMNDKINSLFSNVSAGDTYISYNIYIIREGDTVESIIDKYAISEEKLKEYNDLTDLKLGDKIIIPSLQ